MRCSVLKISEKCTPVSSDRKQDRWGAGRSKRKGPEETSEGIAMINVTTAVIYSQVKVTTLNTLICAIN